MSATRIEREVRVEDLPGLSHNQSIELGRQQIDALVRELKQLDRDDWDKPTDCDRWAVRDIVAHVLGWAQVTPSPAEMVKLRKSSMALRKEMGGSLDSQNEAMVLARRDMTPDQLISELENAAPRFLTFRKRAGSVVGYLPLVVDTVGMTNARFLLGQIFTRDHFMHRIDISRATGKEIDLGAPEKRIVRDLVRHWGRSSKADARLHLTGPAGDGFVTGSGSSATITGDAIEFCRLLAKRAEPSAMKIEGDRVAAETWLKAHVPF